jgi:predicted alpha/beta superfamily hydrolase
VIVAIGYQTALPFDTAARAWDYTPPLKTFKLAPGNPRCRREKPEAMTFFASC